MVLYAIFCSIFRSLSSVSSAVHSPVTGPVETYTLLLCGMWVGVLVIRENRKKVKGEVLKVTCLMHQCHYELCCVTMTDILCKQVNEKIKKFFEFKRDI